MSQATPFPLANLPPELQDEIWTLTLRTAPKVFHLAATTPSPTDPTKHRITFHHKHPDPSAVLVCRQSRAAARRAGFIPLPQPSDAAPVWFNARHDILFLDSHTTGLLLSFSPEAPQLSIVPSPRSLRNIGFEQGTWPPNRNIPIEAYEGSVVRDFMALLVPTLLEAAPHLEELHYLAPMIQERHDVNLLECLLTPLDPQVDVWNRRRSPRRTCEQVRSEFVAGLEALELPRGPPVLKAWRLLRLHPLEDCHKEVLAKMQSLPI